MEFYIPMETTLQIDGMLFRPLSRWQDIQRHETEIVAVFGIRWNSDRATWETKRDTCFVGKLTSGKMSRKDSGNELIHYLCVYGAKQYIYNDEEQQWEKTPTDIVCAVLEESHKARNVHILDSIIIE